MKILHIKPKKILQWNFFALPPNSEKNNSKVAGSKINIEIDLFLILLNIWNTKVDCHSHLDGYQNRRG